MNVRPSPSRLWTSIVTIMSRSANRRLPDELCREAILLLDDAMQKPPAELKAEVDVAERAVAALRDELITLKLAPPYEAWEEHSLWAYFDAVGGGDTPAISNTRRPAPPLIGPLRNSRELEPLQRSVRLDFHRFPSVRAIQMRYGWRNQAPAMIRGWYEPRDAPRVDRVRRSGLELRAREVGQVSDNVREPIIRERTRIERAGPPIVPLGPK